MLSLTSNEVNELELDKSGDTMMRESTEHRRISVTSPSSHIQFITPRGLQHLLDTSPSTVQVVDCRSFLNYNTERIIGSVNVYCPPLVKKRFQTCLPLSSMLSNETKTTMVRATVETVVLHDQCTNHALFYLGQSDLPLVYESLKSYLGDKTYMVLNGGFCSFHQQFPKYCSRHTSFSGQLLHAKRADALMHSTLAAQGSITFDPPNAPAPKRKLSLSPVELLPYLYIGDAGHSTRKELLLGFKISAILNVSTSCENHFPTDFRYKVIPVEDSQNANLFEWFQDAILFIERERRSGGKVLVHCHGGISRSATVCLAYLMFSRHLRLDEAFDYIRARRHVISPNANFMIQLSQFETELRKLGVCWPSTWSQRYPSSSSSTTTEEDISWEDHSSRLESSSSTTSSELSWQGLGHRGTSDTAVGDLHCDPVSASPSIRDQHHPILCSQRSSSPRKFKTTDSNPTSTLEAYSQSTNQASHVETQTLEAYPHLQHGISEEVFLQPSGETFSVRHPMGCSDSLAEENHTELVENDLVDTDLRHLSPPPKSPSLNFGCLHEKIKTSGQNFFFGSCPDITVGTFSQEPKISQMKSTDEQNLENGFRSNVYSNGNRQADEEEDLSDS